MHYSILLNEEKRIHKSVQKRLSILGIKNSQTPKQQNKSTQSQFYSPRQNTQNISTYDQMFSQLSHHKKSTVAQIISELKKPPPQISYNLTLPKLDKTQIKDKNKLQDMLRTYCIQNQGKLNQKISSVHKVRLNTQSEFQLFEALDHIDEVLPNKLILKKEYGIDEKNLFRNSLGIEKIMMSRYLRKLNIH